MAKGDPTIDFPLGDESVPTAEESAQERAPPAEDATEAGAPAVAATEVSPPVPTPRMAARPAKPKLSLDHPLVQDIMFNPRRWRIWPTVAVLRWLLRQAPIGMRRLVYRSLPSLGFATSEIEDVAIQTSGTGGVELILGAPGIATDGSPLPSADISRIIADRERGGGLGLWLDMPGDRFMHQAELSMSRHNAAFALATGGNIRAAEAAADLVGRSAPLAADAGGVLLSAWQREPAGALGLAAMFVGAASSTGLSSVLGAFTSLSVLIEEFAGAEVPVLRPSRVGGRFGAMIGTKCVLPSAGVAVVVRGGSLVSAQDWAQQRRRRASLYLLARTYIGSHVPQVRIFLTLDASNAPPAKLGLAALGGLAVLGKASENVRLPLAADSPTAI